MLRFFMSVHSACLVLTLGFLGAPASTLQAQTPVFTAIAAGGHQSLALKCNGSVMAWGDRGGGPFNPTSMPPQFPKPIAGLNKIIAIAAGEAHSLALQEDGTVWVWGLNDYCQFGQDDYCQPRQPGTIWQSSTPLKVPNLQKPITTIAAGTYHSLALDSGGIVWAWGRNDFGQLGGAFGNAPRQVHLPKIAAIAAGRDFSLALDTTGTVWAWGRNEVGQLGGGNISTFSTTPAPVHVPAMVKKIAAGYNHALALDADDTVWAWGNNEFGKLGNDVDSVSAEPISVPVPAGIASIAAGRFHSIALLNDNTVWTWGGNTFWQLGIGYSPSSSHIPFPVPNLKAEAIAAGSVHSLALETNGAVIEAWGDNKYGQLGNGTAVPSVLPDSVMAHLEAMAAWWAFDEMAGPTATDRAGVARNDGTFQPARGSKAPKVQLGKVGPALCFDASNSVTVPDHSELDLDTGDLTIAVWFRTTAPNGLLNIVDKRDSRGFLLVQGYKLFVLNGHMLFQMATEICHSSDSDPCFYYFTTFGVAGSPNVADNAWHHLSVTVNRKNSDGGIFYVDGKRVPGSFDPTSRAESLGNDADVRIGGDYVPYPYCLDELEIHKRVLSETEIKTIYDAGSEGKCR